MNINWKSYYKDEQVKEYNLNEYKDDSIEVKLFNTNDIEMKGDHQINYLNKYLGELPMMYYIWKNNLKSEFITISQYRRDITYIDYDKLKNEKTIQVIYQWDENNNIKLKDRLLTYCDPSGIIKKNIWEFIQEHYCLSDEELEAIQNKTEYRCMACFVWAMNWETFCELCQLIFGILDKLFPNNDWQNVDTLTNFMEEQKRLYYEKYPDKYDFKYDNDRFLTFIMEDTLSILLGQFFYIFCNNKFFDNTYILTHVNKNNTLEEIGTWYKLNIKTNPFTIFVCCDDDSYDDIYRFMKKCDWEYNRICVINNINKINHICKCLDITQYIDLNIPLDLYTNKYKIRNIN